MKRKMRIIKLCVKYTICVRGLMKRKTRIIKLCIKYTICVRGLMKKKTRMKLCTKNTCERIDEKKDKDD